MSRIGKLPVAIPAKTAVSVGDDNTVTVKGPKGELAYKFNSNMKIEEQDGHIIISRPSDSKQMRAMHGLTRALLHNMVVGVSEGFVKTLDIIGVGYRAQMSGTKLVLNVGYSHQVEINPPEGISFECPANTKIIVRGIDRQKVGQVAADIRSVRPPEPYKGKGIRYTGEFVRRKEGKSGM